jgi:hypothetical protein
VSRIRTIKPDFWEDEAIGLLSREARLLFVASWNLADDEGLLRWSPAFVKASVFMYDDDIQAAECSAAMSELTDAGLVFPYKGGKAKQQLAYVIHFLRHQRINRPQPGKLPPPSVQSGDVLDMYVRRDGSVCHLCDREVTRDHDKRDLWPSLDHLTPRSQGGSDYPSNIKLSHISCNKARRDTPVDVYRAARGYVTDSVNSSVKAAGTDSLPEGNGKEGKGTGKGSEVVAYRADVESLCSYLADKIEGNGSKRPKVTERWRTACRLLIDTDGRTEEQVRTAIDWCQADEFWRANILSMPTLREKYDQLRLAASRTRTPSGAADDDDYWNRALGRAEAREARSA